MKRILTLCICVALIVSALPVLTLTAVADGENLALGKPVTANCDRGDGYYLPSYVTDGDITSVWSGPSGFDGAAVTVDLEQEYVITEVVLHNRSDITTAQYRRAVTIEFSNTPDFAVRESVVAMGAGVGDESEFGVPVVVKPPSAKPYRYVRAVKTNNTTHVVAEIEVYGYEYDPNALRVGKDVEGTQLYGPVMLLRYLNLIDLENEADEIYGVNSVMTRGAAIDAIVKAFAPNIGYSEKSPFVDVPENYAYYESIAKAYQLKYITGDDHSSFRPNDYTTVTEFMLMTFRALLYQEVGEEVQGMTMSQMLASAKKLGLLKDTGLSDLSAFITRGQMAQVFYNALLAPGFSLVISDNETSFYEKDYDLLYKKHDMILTKGIVNENRISTLDGTSKSGKTAAEISGQSFVDTSGALDAFLGKEVIVASSTDNQKVILFAWATSTNTEVVLPAKSLSSTEADIQSKRVVAYDEKSDKDINYTLAENVRVIKNDVAYPYYLPADLLITNGQLRLLDNNDDGIYEVVFVETYTLHYLKSGFYDDKSLTIIDSAGVRQTFDMDSLTITNGFGNSISPKKVAVDTVVQLFKSEDGSQVRIVVYDEPVIGVMTGLSDTEVMVDGTSYPLSLVYQNASRAHEPVPGETVAVYVDAAGEALWVERDVEAIFDGWTIAFSQAVGVEQGLDGGLCFRLFTLNGEWKEIYAAEKVDVDGTVMTKDKLITTINSDSDNRFSGELVRFKLDASGYLKALDTKLATTAEEDGTQRLTKGTEIASGQYNWTSNSGAFWSGHEMVAQGKKDTPVFVLPTIGGVYPSTSSYDSYFRATQLNSIISTNTTLMRTLVPYMVDEFGYPTCFTTIQAYPAGTATSSYVTSESSPYMIVESIVKGVNSSGEIVQQVNGYSISGSTITPDTTINMSPDLSMVETGLLFQEAPDCFDGKHLISSADFANLADRENYISSVTEIGIGDVVRYQTRGDSIYAIERIYDYNTAQRPAAGTHTAENGVWFVSATSNVTYYQAAYRHQVGTFSKLSSSAFTIDTLAGAKETYTTSVFKKFYTIDTDSREPKIVEVKDLSQFEGADVQVIVYSYTGSPCMVMVYPYNS